MLLAVCRTFNPMSRTFRTLILGVALAVSVAGCYGPFNLTRRLHRWNGRVGSDKWEDEFVFLLLAWAPMYSIAVLADAIVFNMFEFWGEKNPVEPPPRAETPRPATTRIARGEQAAVLTYTPGTDGGRLSLDAFDHGRPAGSLRLQRCRGETVGLDAQGRVVLRAVELADGGLRIQDGQGREVAAYSRQQVDALSPSYAKMARVRDP